MHLRPLLVLVLSFGLLLAGPSYSFAQDISTTFPFDIFPRRPLNTHLLGINAFANDSRFGTIRAQLSEVRSSLHIRYIRVLLTWNDAVQPSPKSPPFFGFYDAILKNIPRGAVAIPILTGLPSWMSNSRNWIKGDPRKTFVEMWVKRVARRYARYSRVEGFQIWNEPNMRSNAQNDTLDLTNHPENYVAMAKQARATVRRYARGKKVIGAATTSIVQDFPDTLNYNYALQAGGLESAVDVWAVHYYGSSHERLYFGVADFLNSLHKPLWITEIGTKGVNEQRAYMERAIPLIKELVPKAARFYIYQFTEATNANETYGLKNPTPGSRTSDLYRYLKSAR